mmetsp:Transcript_12304/g.39001  ORF Transcript_12304/g.39001 Transcript_12304/m.39001 type:complete len:370 (+) Transcript_12304:168-1277(+)
MSSNMTDKQVAVVAVGAAVGAVAIGYTFMKRDGFREKPRTFDLGGGGGAAYKEKDVNQHWNNYDSYFTQKAGEGVVSGDKTQAPTYVDTFYNLVTDIYEWGWGQSFHFSPAITGMSHTQAECVHEYNIADAIKGKPGMKLLDVGCGVGGPLRRVAKHSGSHVTGITINEYQVKRARAHNERAGLADKTTVVQGNFLEMPFADNTFDGVYSIEATCHAPTVEEVYRECFRVLKPGGLYATYEWVTTPLYDPANTEHVRIIDSINHGNALPDMRTYKQVVEAAQRAGFQVVEDRDVALPPAEPWWTRLVMGRFQYLLNSAAVNFSTFIGIAPKGTKEVHDMLVNVAVSLSEGGETGIFSPMHLLVLRKPAN